MKLLEGSYLEFYERITKYVSKKRIFTDSLHTLAYGTDASKFSQKKIWILSI